MFRTSRHLIIFFICVVLSSLSFVQADESHMEIIPLQYRPAELILPSLRQFAGKDVQITSASNQIIIKGPRSKLAEMHALIDELDTPLSQLVISIRNNAYQDQNRGSVSYSDTVRTNKDKTGLSFGGNNHSTIIRHRSTTNNNNLSQQVRATEGYPALIETGSEIPITTITRESLYRDLTISQEYKPVVKGFYVTPLLLNGDNILLSLSTTKQKQNNQRQIETDKYGGTISGKLNQWILIGGNKEEERNKTTGITKHYRSNLNSNNNLYIKVERVLPQ